MESKEVEHDKKCYEYHRQKYLKLQEQFKNEQDKAHDSTREYYQLLQKSDKAQRVRIQAVYEKQKDAITKRIAHLTRKIDSTRRKMNEIAEKLPTRVAPSKPPSSTLSQNGLNMVQENHAETPPVQLAVPGPTSRSASDPGIADDDHQCSIEDMNESVSNRTSLIDGNFELQSAHSDGKLESRDSFPAPNTIDNLMQNLISDETIRIDDRINNLTERLDKHEGDIEKMRTDSISSDMNHRENAEQLEERSKQLEADIFEYTDNQQLEIQQLKNQINELYEKFDYDSRRLQREFNEKMENVYECIEKLELGRANDQNGNGHHGESSSRLVGDFREALANIFIGMIGLLLYIISTIQNVLAPLTRSTSRTLLSLLIVLLSVALYYYVPELLPITKRFLQSLIWFKN